MQLNTDRTVTIKTFSDQTAADVAAAELEKAGIRYIVVNNDASGMLPFLRVTGIKLMVDSKDAEEARKILADLNAPGDSSSATHQGELPLKSSRQFDGLALSVGLILGIAAAMAYREFQALRTYDYSFDRNGDRWPDDITHYERGIAIWRHMDENFDRRIDYWEYYNADGDKAERSEMDNNFDGKVDSWGKFRDGQAVEIQSDTDFNGLPDVTAFYSSRLLTHIDWRPSGTNIVTVREIYLHGNPNPSEQLRDLDSDGYFDVSVKFDPFFQPISTNHLRRSTIP